MVTWTDTYITTITDKVGLTFLWYSQCLISVEKLVFLQTVKPPTAKEVKKQLKTRRKCASGKGLWIFDEDSLIDRYTEIIENDPEQDDLFSTATAPQETKG